MNVSSASFSKLWCSALRISVNIAAEFFWEVPVHLSFIDSLDWSHFAIGQSVIWFNPKNTSNIGPSTHVWAVDQNDVVCSWIKKIPSLIMVGSHVLVEDVDWFTLFCLWELPGLLEVLGSFVQIKIITIGIWVARSFNWSIKSFCLTTPSIIVNNFHCMNMLAIVAVPKCVLTVLLPPFSIQIRNVSFSSWFWFWASWIDLSKVNTLIFHRASEENISCWWVISKSALGCAVLVVKFHRSSVIVVIWVARVLAPCHFHKDWINNSLRHWKRTVLKNTSHIYGVRVWWSSEFVWNTSQNIW